MTHAFQDKPCAAAGLISYRYPSTFGGYIMIGATDHVDAVREANRSLTHGDATIDALQIWDGTSYVSAVGFDAAHSPVKPR